MGKIKSLGLVIAFIVLTSLAAFGGYASFLLYPGLAFLMYFLVNTDTFRSEFQTAIVGVGLYIVFISWYLIFYNKAPYLFALIYTFSIMAAIEAWRFTVHSFSNVWGLMNLVVFWISMEYLMMVWLPFDISSWLIGTPLYTTDLVGDWVKYIGLQGFSLWALVVGVVLFKTIGEEGINFIALIGAVLLVVLPAVINVPVGDESIYAEGEWVGRTCVWISVLILAYSFVQRKTQKK